VAFGFTILLARQAVEESSKKAESNSLFPGFIVDCLYALLRGPSCIKFSGGDASCDGTGERRHFQKRFQTQKGFQKRKSQNQNQKRKSRPCSSKRVETKRWGRKKEETRWAGKRWEETRWVGRRWEEREREEKEGSRSTEGGEPKGPCQTREPS
jgi:hypothetical protein